MKFALVAAADQKLGIGIHNKMPWDLKGDLKHFSDVTSRAPEGKYNAVIMGRNTWLSLPEKHRPLKNRLNVVLSREPIVLPEGVVRATSFDDAFEQIEKNPLISEVFVIGGANVYAQAIGLPGCDKIYLTEVLATFETDTFFPGIDETVFKKTSESKEHEENGIRYRFALYERVLN